MGLTDYFKTSQQYGNTGQPKGAYLKLDYFQGILIHPDGFKIPASYLAGKYSDLLTYLQEAQLNDPSVRLWCLPRFEGATDNTPAPEKKTTPYGTQKSLVEKPHSYDFELEDFGVEFYKDLRKYNGRSDMRGMLFQENALLYEFDNEGNAQGAEITMFANQAKIGNVADYAKQIVTIEIKDKGFLTDRCHSLEIPKGKEFISNFKGVINVELSEPATNVIKAVEAISKFDLYDTYADDLAVKGAWLCRHLLTGEVAAPTAVAKSVANKGWTITKPVAFTGDTEVYLASPSALAALGVGSATAGGFESFTHVLGE